MLLVAFGLRELLLASTPPSSSPPPLREEDRVSISYANATYTTLIWYGTESTVMNALSTLTHHGIIYVPLGYSHTFPQQTNMEEVHGGISSRSTNIKNFLLTIFVYRLRMGSWLFRWP